MPESFFTKRDVRDYHCMFLSNRTCANLLKKHALIIRYPFRYSVHRETRSLPASLPVSDQSNASRWLRPRVRGSCNRLLQLCLHGVPLDSPNNVRNPVIMWILLSRGKEKEREIEGDQVWDLKTISNQHVWPSHKILSAKYFFLQ